MSADKKNTHSSRVRRAFTSWVRTVFAFQTIEQNSSREKPHSVNTCSLSSTLYNGLTSDGTFKNCGMRREKEERGAGEVGKVQSKGKERKKWPIEADQHEMRAKSAKEFESAVANDQI